mmetsp:Transcript_35558/g.89964  ORF Transcript_35558/g.89964 Transcript_35558/m.89964 type:complete len:423 (-) Transcript_35558:3442-4710(-)
MLSVPNTDHATLLPPYSHLPVAHVAMHAPPSPPGHSCHHPAHCTGCARQQTSAQSVLPALLVALAVAGCLLAGGGGRLVDGGRHGGQHKVNVEGHHRRAFVQAAHARVLRLGRRVRLAQLGQRGQRRLQLVPVRGRVGAEALSGRPALAGHAARGVPRDERGHAVQAGVAAQPRLHHQQPAQHVHAVQVHARHLQHEECLWQLDARRARRHARALQHHRQLRRLLLVQAQRLRSPLVQHVPAVIRHPRGQRLQQLVAQAVGRRVGGQRRGQAVDRRHHGGVLVGALQRGRVRLGPELRAQVRLDDNLDQVQRGLLQPARQQQARHVEADDQGVNRALRGAAQLERGAVARLRLARTPLRLQQAGQVGGDERAQVRQPRVLEVHRRVDVGIRGCSSRWWFAGHRANHGRRAKRGRRPPARRCM